MGGNFFSWNKSTYYIFHSNTKEKKTFFLGKDVDDQDIIGFEVYDNKLDEWNPVPEWQMAQGRYRYTKKNFAIYILVFYSSKTTNFLWL